MDPRIFQCFAALLDYPAPGLGEVANDCASLVPDAGAARLHDFAAFVAEIDPGCLEEIYTGVFELNAACYPYVGYHLFGETYKRSVFLLGLKQRYAAHGFVTGSELADHVAVLLRFVAMCSDATLSEEIIRDALLPALDKMCGGKEENDLAEEDAPTHHRGRAEYQQLLRALQVTLQTWARGETVPALAKIASPLRTSV